MKESNEKCSNKLSLETMKKTLRMEPEIFENNFI